MSILNDAMELKKIFEADDIRDPFDSVSAEDIEARKSDEQKREEAEQKRRREEQRIRIEQRRADAVVGYNRLATEVIPKLGMTVDPTSQAPSDQNYNQWSNSYNITAIRDDGAKLRMYVHEERRDKTMLTVHLNYDPKIDDNDSDSKGFAGFDQDEEPTAINISFKKTDQKIVDEIQRRLLSKFEEAKGVSDTRVTKEVGRVRLKRKTLQDTCKILGIEYDSEYYGRRYNQTVNKYFSDSSKIEDITVEPRWDGGRVKVNLNVKAEAIPELMKKLKGMITHES